MAHSMDTFGKGNENHVACFCQRPAVIIKSWTDQNPGRRFYKCRGVAGRDCSFFQWIDYPKPQGWQMLALLEAMDLIREQKKKIESLKKEVELSSSKIDEKKTVKVKSDDEDREESDALKLEVLLLKREILVLRNVLAFGLIGVVGATTVVMIMCSSLLTKIKKTNK